jgi:hypothetical protein
MASPITHIILVNEAQNHFERDIQSDKADKIETILNLYPGELNIGAISPDLLYFTEDFVMKLFSASQLQDMHKLADMMHVRKTNQFLLESINEIRNMKKGKLKDLLFSFLSGHLAHIIADGIVHPFIRDKVGDYNDLTKLDHRMLEMRLDVYVTEDLVGFNMNDCQFAEYLESENTKPIAKLITNVLNRVYKDELEKECGEKLKLKTVEGAINASRKALKTSSGNFNLKWYLGDLLEKKGLKHPDLNEIKRMKNKDLVLLHPIDREEKGLSGNFLNVETIHFLDDVCPQFVEKYIEKIEKLYDIIYTNAPLDEDDFVAINLDTGRTLDDPDYKNIPFYWR